LRGIKKFVNPLENPARHARLPVENTLPVIQKIAAMGKNDFNLIPEHPTQSRSCPAMTPSISFLRWMNDRFMFYSDGTMEVKDRPSLQVSLTVPSGDSFGL